MDLFRAIFIASGVICFLLVVVDVLSKDPKRYRRRWDD